MQPEDLRQLKCLSGSGCDQQPLRCLEPDPELIERWGIDSERRRGTEQATWRNADALMSLSFCLPPKGRAVS